MLSIVLLSPLARVAPGAVLARRLLRLLGWAGLVLFGLLGVAAPAGAEARRRARRLAPRRRPRPGARQGRRERRLAGRGRRSASSIRACAWRPARASSPTCRPASGSGARPGSACAARPGRRPGTSICRSPSRCSAAPWWCRPAPPPAASWPRPTWPRPRSTWPRSSPPPWSTPKLAVGRTLAQNLRPGQTLRQTHLKSRQWFVAGETVRVVASRRRLRARERGPGAQQRHRRPAGAGAHRKRAGPDRPALRRAPGRGGAVKPTLPAGAAPTAPETPKVARSDADTPSMLMGAPPAGADGAHQ